MKFMQLFKLFKLKFLGLIPEIWIFRCMCVSKLWLGA